MTYRRGDPETGIVIILALGLALILLGLVAAWIVVL